MGHNVIVDSERHGRKTLDIGATGEKNETYIMHLDCIHEVNTSRRKQVPLGPFVGKLLVHLWTNTCFYTDPVISNSIMEIGVILLILDENSVR